MKKTLPILLTATLIAGCAGNPYGGGYQGAPYSGGGGVNKTAVGGGVGAAVGAGVGALASKNKTKGALIGGAVGALLGAGVGYYLDSQAKQLEQNLQGTGMQVQRQQDSIKVVMPSNVSFDTGSARLLPAAQRALASVAASANQDPGSTLEIVGHTDSRGAADMNQRLSEDRANSAAQYLSSQGIARARIGTRGMGATQPIASNDTEAGQAQNRRVEITIHPSPNAGQQQPPAGQGYGQPPAGGAYPPNGGYQQPAGGYPPY